MKFILCCVTSDLSDNLTETCIVKNSNGTATVIPNYNPDYDLEAATCLCMLDGDHITVV